MRTARRLDGRAARRPLSPGAPPQSPLSTVKAMPSAIVNTLVGAPRLRQAARQARRLSRPGIPGGAGRGDRRASAGPPHDRRIPCRRTAVAGVPPPTLARRAGGGAQAPFGSIAYMPWRDRRRGRPPEGRSKTLPASRERRIMCPQAGLIARRSGSVARGGPVPPPDSQTSILRSAGAPCRTGDPGVPAWSRPAAPTPASIPGAESGLPRSP